MTYATASEPEFSASPAPARESAPSVEGLGAAHADGLQLGNTDIAQSGWVPTKYRECSACGGRGVHVTGWSASRWGTPMCMACVGTGRVSL